MRLATSASVVNPLNKCLHRSLEVLMIVLFSMHMSQLQHASSYLSKTSHKAANDLHTLSMIYIPKIYMAYCIHGRVPEECPARVADLIAACMHSDPKMRPTAQEVTLHLRS